MMVTYRSLTEDAVLEMLVDGQSPENILHQLDVTRGMLNRAIGKLLRRFDERDHVEAAIKAVRSGEAKISQRLIDSWERRNLC